MSAPVLKLQHTTKTFNSTPVLHECSFTAAPGEHILIRGPNGAGKTTLLRCAAGLESFESGSIQVGPFVLTPTIDEKVRGALYRSGILGYVFQNADPWPHLSVINNIALPLRKRCGFSKKNATSRAEEFLEIVGLYHKKHDYPSFLSGGQARRLIITRTLALDPQIVLLDEITANLDHDGRRSIVEILKEKAAEKTVILITHDERGFESFVDTYYDLYDGRLASVTAHHTS